MDSPIPTIAYDSPLNVDPGSFDASVVSLLISLGGEQYIDIFRSRNISQETLMELSDDDLTRLGVDDENVRAGLIKEVKNFPMYETISEKKKLNPLDLDLTEIATMLSDSNQHMHRIHLSMLSINLAIKNKKLEDGILDNKPMTFIVDKTLTEMNKVLDKMDNNINKNFKCLYKRNEYRLLKKIAVGTIGTAAVAVLSLYFVRSLRNLK